MADLETLKAQRKAARANVTRIKGLISSSMSIAELECRLSLVEAYFKQILTIQTDIETINPQDQARADIEDSCIKTKAKIIELLGDNYKRSSLETSIAVPFATTSKLPSLDLPKFDGKYSAYKNFISSFKQFVDNDSSLSTIEKFNHLLHCLSGQALDTVSAFQVTAENYQKALKRLEQRYDNTTLIFLEHIANLYDLPEVQKPTATQLRSLVDRASAIYSSLKSLGSEEEICNAMLIHLVSKKTDIETQIKWKEKLDFEKLPSWDTFCKHLERSCQVLESADSINPTVNFKNSRRNVPKQQTFRSSFHTHQKSCVLCKNLDHFISGCPKFKSMTHEARFNSVKKLGLCLNCLSDGHLVSKCSSKYTCRTCKKSHHTLLHRTSTDNSADPTTSAQPSTSSTWIEPTSSAAVNTHIEQSSDRVILATAVILIRDSIGELKLCRALLDSCSQVNLITENFARILNLPKRKKAVDIIGVGGTASKIRFETSTIIRSRYNSQEIDIDLLITNRVSGYQPEMDVDIRDWNLPSHIELADELFYQSQRIDLLLGAENFFEILRPLQIKLGSNLPTLQETHFGWVVSGRYKAIPEVKRNLVRSFHVLTDDDRDENDRDENLNLQLERLWSLEEIKSSSLEWSKEHQACESSFVSNVECLKDGRIQVMLPFKDNPSILGSSHDLALKRFNSLEKRLQRNEPVRQQYIEFMREYEQLGHMSPVDNVNLNQPHYCHISTFLGQIARALNYVSYSMRPQKRHLKYH